MDSDEDIAVKLENNQQAYVIAMAYKIQAYKILIFTDTILMGKIHGKWLYNIVFLNDLKPLSDRF